MFVFWAAAHQQPESVTFKQQHAVVCYRFLRAAKYIDYAERKHALA